MKEKRGNKKVKKVKKLKYVKKKPLKHNTKKIKLLIKHVKKKPLKHNKLKHSAKKLKKIHNQKNISKISDHKIKSSGKIIDNKKIVHIPSGIRGFDKLTQGGFVYGSVNAVVGESGSGKTLFAMQFIMEGIKKGETCLYITFEEKKEDFYKNMMKCGWNLDEAESSGKFIFIEYSPEKIKLMLEEGGGEIESLIISKKVKRLVIDSITSFAMLFEDKISRRGYILSLFDTLREWDCTVLVTSLSDLSDLKLRESSAVEFEADSIILLHFPLIKNKRERLLEIRKMRGTKHSINMYPLKIDKGVSVLNKPRKVSF